MYKIFFNDTPILIEEGDSNTELSPITTKKDLKSILFQFLSNENREPLNLIHSSPETVFDWIKDILVYIEAAGGLVENDDAELLFIHRLGVWDLPKGKIEECETPETAAYREIKEECQIQSHTCQQHLKDTYHIYEQGGDWFLKKTYWFYFKTTDNDETPQPQTEENIERVAWLEGMEVDLALLDTYPSIEEVYAAYQSILE